MAVLGKGTVLKVVFLNWVFEDYGKSLRFGKRVGAQIGFKGGLCFPGLSFSLNLMGIDSFEANSFSWIFLLLGCFRFWARSGIVLDWEKKMNLVHGNGLRCEILNPCAGPKVLIIII